MPSHVPSHSTQFRQLAPGPSLLAELGHSIMGLPASTPFIGPGVSLIRSLAQGATQGPGELFRNVAQGVDPAFGFGAARLYGRPERENLPIQFAAGLLSPGFGEFKALGKPLRAITQHFREFPEASLAILKRQGSAVMDAIERATPKQLEELFQVLDARRINRAKGAKVDSFERVLLDEVAKKRKQHRFIQADDPAFNTEFQDVNITDEQLEHLQNLEDFPGGHAPPEGDIPGISDQPSFEDLSGRAKIPSDEEIEAGVGRFFANEMFDEARTLADLNEEAINAGKGTISFFSERLADDAQRAEALFTSASLDDLTDFMDTIYDDLGARANEIAEAGSNPLEYQLMAARVKKEFLWRMYPGATHPDRQQALKILAGIHEVSEDVIDSNFRTLWQHNQNQIAALQFMWDTMRGLGR